ncbi:MAG: hypothetical protein IQL11_13155 [Bacteroidales bacterium]|nr:hypothetical protein [Bacteroidales bacterium]
MREGTMPIIENGFVSLAGPRNARIFRKGSPPVELTPADDFSFLLK